MFVQCFKHAKCHKAPRIITSVLALKPQRGVIEYKLQCKLQCPQSQTPCKWNLSKLDCKTPLIELYFISSLPVKSLPFKITFATCREELCCHRGTVADEFFWRGKCWPISRWIMKTNTFFCFIQGKGPSSRDFFTLERILRLFCFEGMWKR